MEYGCRQQLYIQKAIVFVVPMIFTKAKKPKSQPQKYDNNYCCKYV